MGTNAVVITGIGMVGDMGTDMIRCRGWGMAIGTIWSPC